MGAASAPLLDHGTVLKVSIGDDTTDQVAAIAAAVREATGTDHILVRHDLGAGRIRCTWTDAADSDAVRARLTSTPEGLLDAARTLPDGSLDTSRLRLTRRHSMHLYAGVLLRSHRHGQQQRATPFDVSDLLETVAATSESALIADLGLRNGHELREVTGALITLASHRVPREEDRSSDHDLTPGFYSAHLAALPVTIAARGDAVLAAHA